MGPIERTLRYSGTLGAKNTITLTAKVPGRIESILVREGQLVNRDDILARVEDEAVRLQMQQAYALWQATQAQFEKARRGVRPEELEKARALYQKAQEDLVNAGRSIKMLEEGASPEEQQLARSQAQAAKATYDLARLQVDYIEIRAPEAGIIAKILQDPGNSVGPTVPILVQADPVLAEVAVPEVHYGELLQRAEPIECRVRPAGYPGAEPFVGSLTALAPTVSPGSRTSTATVELPNPQLLLRTGMYAEIELVMERREGVLLLPESAVLDRDGTQVVFVAGDSEPVARRRIVQVGLAAPGAVEIGRGISPQDRAIVEGNAFLKDGQRILILEER